MPTPTKGPRLGGSPAHERLLLANLATALFEHGRITTTAAKAKRLRPLAERLVTFAKRGDLHARRQVLTVVRDKSVVHTLFEEIGPRFAQRPGGYTRIVRVANRKGDNAPMAVIELVEALTVAQQAVGEGERARGTRFARPSRGARAAAGAGTAGAGAVGAGVAGLAGEPDEDDPDTGGAAPDAADEATDDDAVDDVVAVDAAADAADDTADDADDAAGATGAADADGGVADEAGGQPAEGATSGQTEQATESSQAEGDDPDSTTAGTT